MHCNKYPTYRGALLPENLKTNSRRPIFQGFQHASAMHGYYSTWFPLTAIFLISEDKFRVIKLKSHYFISASHDVILL
jgi:hypothetical protein